MKSMLFLMQKIVQGKKKIVTVKLEMFANE